MYTRIYSSFITLLTIYSVSFKTYMPGMIGTNVRHIQTLMKSIHVLLLERFGKICKLYVSYSILVHLSG